MPVPPSLVFSKANHMRWLVTVDGLDTITIDGSTLRVAAVAGPLKNIFNVKTQGYGKLAAGAVRTQSDARALLASEQAVAVIGDNVATAMMNLTQRVGAGIGVVDADVDGLDNQTIEINISAATGSGLTTYLDIFIPGAIGA